jgi:hypothetical protein
MQPLHPELLGPLRGEELRREARQAALANLVPLTEGASRLSALALWLGGVLIAAGCRIDAAGRRRARGGRLLIMPTPCGQKP